MIRVIHARNVNEAYHHGLLWLKNRGTEEPSRVGSVVVAPDPVVTYYAQPTERVLFSPMRDANPFFHFMEGLWMLAGRSDVEWPTQFNSTFGQFSDDGKVFHGAYGQRWREWFGYDQLDLIIQELIQNPQSRRCVLTMWDPSVDLHKAVDGSSKDVPCNTHVYFRVKEDGRLDMMVSCRSNDIIWGAYGANAVHMSMMQEYVARCAGYGVGTYTHVSFNFHAYTERFPLDQFQAVAADATSNDLYSGGMTRPYPLMQTVKAVWDEDLANFMMLAHPNNDPTDNYSKIGMFTEPLFAAVAMPMLCAWASHKKKDYKAALRYASDIKAHDWSTACRMWLERRAERLRQKDAAGA